MSRPLPSGDPTQLGPFRLTARLSETPAGIVFLGEDSDGRQASVAVLTRGAAQDAAARDRFRAAILEAIPGRGRPPQLAPGDPAPVLAAQPEGPAPWVATSYRPGVPEAPGGQGAERFLEPVLLTGASEERWPVRRHGPDFRPHWSGGGPAVRVPPPPPVVLPGPSPQRSERGLAAAILTLAAMLAMLAVLMLLVFACQPNPADPPPDPPTDSYRPPPPPSLSPSPSPTPTPRPSSPSPTPAPGDGDGGPL